MPELTGEMVKGSMGGKKRGNVESRKGRMEARKEGAYEMNEERERNEGNEDEMGLEDRSVKQNRGEEIRGERRREEITPS